MIAKTLCICYTVINHTPGGVYGWFNPFSAENCHFIAKN